MMFVGAVYQTSWLQKVMVAVAQKWQSNVFEADSAYPKEFVLSYGLFFTLALTLLVVPVVAKYYARVDFHVRAVPGTQGVEKQDLEKRNALALDLGVSVTDSLQAAAAIVSPLLGAMLSITFGK
jgi:hypothetical protein